MAAKAAAGKAAAKAAAAAAGASALARCLCDPPPGRPSGRARLGGAAPAAAGLLQCPWSRRRVILAQKCMRSC